MKELTQENHGRSPRRRVRQSVLGRLDVSTKGWQRLAVPLALSALAVCGAAMAPQANAVTLNWSAVKEPGVGGAVTSIAVCPADSTKVVVGGDMLGATYSTDGGQNWNDSFGMQNWECGDATWAPGSTSTVWMGTMGGPYKSTDGGRNWVSKRSGMTAPETYWGYNVPIQKIIFDPNNSSRMLAFGGSHRNWNNNSWQIAKYGSVWESTNGGESWSQKAVIANNGSGVGGDVMTAVFAPGSSTTLYAGLRSNGVYRSNDGGATWTAKNSGLPGGATNFIAVHPTNGNTLWWSGVGQRAVYKSTNGGDSWSFSGNGLSYDSAYSHEYCKITATPTNGDILYVSNNNWQQLFRSTDGGANWSSITDNRRPSTPTNLGVQGNWTEVDRNNANTIYTCNSVTIFKTTDAGATWTDISSKAGSATDLWQGRGYSGYVSTRVKWNPLNTNQVVLQGMDDAKFMSSTDMANWRMHGSTMSNWGGGNDVTFGGTNGNTVYVALGQAGWDEAPARSTDGGLTWTSLPKPGSGFASSIYTLPNDPTKVWLLRGGRLYYSSNSGGAWSEINVDNNTTLNDIIGDNASTPNIYITARNGVYKGTPSNSFTRAATIESSENMKISLDPSKAGRFYLASWRYNQWHCGVYRVDNGTQTRINTNEYAYDVAVDPQNANRVVMVTNHNPGVEISQATGVWMTENALAASPTWTQQNTGLPMLRGNTIAIHPTNGTVIVGLNGRGFYKASTGGGSATPTPTPTPTPTTGTNLVVNPSFDAQAFDTQTPSGWSEQQWDTTWTSVTPNANYTEAFGGTRSGARHGTHYSTSAYNAYVSQSFTGLTNGTYTLRVYARRSGTQTKCYLEAKNFGSAAKTANIPLASTYQLVEITGINVSNGQATIGLYSEAGAGDWAYFDDFEFIKQ